MSRLTLIVKGRPADAVSAAHEHGISPMVTHQTHAETVMHAPITDYDKVAGWYMEQREMIAGFGYATGTLLTFVEIAEAVN